MAVVMVGYFLHPNIAQSAAKPSAQAFAKPDAQHLVISMLGRWGMVFGSCNTSV